MDDPAEPTHPRFRRGLLLDQENCTTRSTVSRRRLIQAIPALPIIAVAGPVAAATTDLVLTCDTTLRAPAEAIAAGFRKQAGVRVRIFPTGPGLVLPQLDRQIQNDVVLTSLRVAEAAVQTGSIRSGALRGAWRNRLVIAARAGYGDAVLTQRIAVTDPTTASDMDGPAIVRSLGLNKATMVGVIDTDEVLFLLKTGRADAGLLHMTDFAAMPELRILRTVPDEVATPLTYTAAVTTLAWRPNPQAFVDFLTTPDAQTIWQAHGLEVST